MRSRIIAAFAATLMGVSQLTGGASAVEGPPDPPLLQPSENEHPDLDLVAKANGWTLSEALAQMLAADEVGSIATRTRCNAPKSS
jgi:hypothetical protein